MSAASPSPTRWLKPLSAAPLILATAGWSFLPLEPLRSQAAPPEEVKPENEAVIARLKQDLSSPWTSVSIALRHDCSCTGPHHFGINLHRNNDEITLAPRRDGFQKAVPTGKPRKLSTPELDKILIKTSEDFEAALKSRHPLEIAGPRPRAASDLLAWEAVYRAVGGRSSSGDHLWIVIRINTKDGQREYSDQFAEQDYAEMARWVESFIMD